QQVVLAGGGVRHLLEALTRQGCGTGRRPGMNLEQCGSDLNQSLQETRGSAAARLRGPQALPGFVRLPEEERVEEIDAEEPVGERAPTRGCPRRCHRTTRIGLVRMTVRIAN